MIHFNLKFFLCISFYSKIKFIIIFNDNYFDRYTCKIINNLSLNKLKSKGILTQFFYFLSFLLFDSSPLGDHYIFLDLFEFEDLIFVYFLKLS